MREYRVPQTHRWLYIVTNKPHGVLYTGVTSAGADATYAFGPAPLMENGCVVACAMASHQGT